MVLMFEELKWQVGISILFFCIYKTVGVMVCCPRSPLAVQLVMRLSHSSNFALSAELY